MYKLFTDKAEVFECDIKVEGTSLNKSNARLVIETDTYSLLFKGIIDSDGKCTIPIKKLRGLIEENSKGNIKLEVIAEDTYFTPWESNFEVEASKKVTVEVKSQDEKPVIAESKVEVANVKNVISEADQAHVLNILKLLVKEDINIENLHLRKNKVNKIIAVYQKYKPFSAESKPKIIEGIIKGLEE